MSLEMGGITRGSESAPAAEEIENAQRQKALEAARRRYQKSKEYRKQYAKEYYQRKKKEIEAKAVDLSEEDRLALRARWRAQAQAKRAAMSKEEVEAFRAKQRETSRRAYYAKKGAQPKSAQPRRITHGLTAEQKRRRACDQAREYYAANRDAILAKRKKRGRANGTATAASPTTPPGTSPSAAPGS